MFDLDQIGGTEALTALVREVRAAGDKANALFGQPIAIKTKPDNSPVTEADEKVEAHIVNHLKSAFPKASFLGEETGEYEGDSGVRFVLDPIDGTRAFMRGLPTWSVLLGMEFEGEPVIGIAYMPAQDLMFVAVQGGGSRVNGQPLSVSQTGKLKDAMVMHGVLQQFTDEGAADLLTAVSENSDSARGFADFEGYKNVLLGHADAMVDPGVKPYDICAPAVLIREAGGTFTSLTGETTIYGPGGLASNGIIHNELLAITRR